MIGDSLVGCGALRQLPGSQTCVCGSSLSILPGGVYTALASVRQCKKLCRVQHAIVMDSTFTGVRPIGVIKTQKRLARIPIAFSTTLRARLKW